MFKPNLNKIILCATAKQLVAGIWHADKLQQSKIFLHDALGQQTFIQWLSLYANIPIHLIANAVEEDYRLEHLPHSTGREKHELIARKLNQFYRGLIFRTAHFIGREKDKRKDDKYLFAALNNDDFLETWLKLIQQLDGELVGVYLLPMLSQILCHKPFYTQKLAPTHTLLCEKLSSGLRQTYLHNGHLRMSRLIPDVPEDASQLGYFYLVETQKTRLYLMSKRFISRDVTIHLQLVSANDEMQAIQQSFRQEPGIECETLPLGEIARHLNIEPHMLKTTPELLHMQLLAMGHPADNLAPEALTRTFQLKKLGYFAKISGTVVATLGLIAAAYFLLAGLEQQTAFENAKQATAMIEQRYQKLSAQHPQAALTAQQLKTAVLLQAAIQQHPQSPISAAKTVSAVLEKMPEIALNKLVWQQTNMLENNAAPANAPQKLVEVVRVQAEIQPFDGNYHAAKEKAQQFAQILSQQAGIASIQILESPANSSSQNDLRGSTSANLTTESARAEFVVQLTLKANAP
jgi:hypothetical protein